MSFFCDICNKEFICELEEQVGQSMIFYTADRFAYYAVLSEVIDCRVALLTPGAGQTSVIVRLPDQTFVTQGPGTIEESFTYIDLCSLVATTVGLTEIPPGFAFVP